MTLEELQLIHEALDFLAEANWSALKSLDEIEDAVDIEATREQNKEIEALMKKVMDEINTKYGV